MKKNPLLQPVTLEAVPLSNPIQPAEARELCSSTEWKVVESSFSPDIETLTAADLKAKLDRALKLHRGSVDLISLQHSELRRQTTQRKVALFNETARRFEAALKLADPSFGAEPSGAAVDASPLEESGQITVNAIPKPAERQIKGRGIGLPSGQGDQPRQKPGPRPIPGHGGSAIRRPQGRRASKSR